MTCTRCEGTGFLNHEQIPAEVLAEVFDEGTKAILRWTETEKGKASDVTVCDCCGNGEGEWYGEPGQHYTSQDPIGKHGPYAYNGGLCECH
jgi:hypothetical protein